MSSRTKNFEVEDFKLNAQTNIIRWNKIWYIND